jgi:hypothetical protein
LWDNVLARHRFSTSGAAQLQADLAAICHVVDQAVGLGVAESGLRKCLEGAQLVGLAVKGGKSQMRTSSSAKSGDEAEDGWDAWEGEAEGQDSAPKKEHAAGGGGEELGLWEVEQRLFADNQSARDVLEELGFETLTETEARAVLGRRVELAG